MKFAIVESLLVVGNLATASLALRESEFPIGLPGTGWVDWLARFLTDPKIEEIVLATILCVAIYWAFQILTSARLAIWLIALLALLSHMPAIWSHSEPHLLQLLGLGSSIADVDAQIWDVPLFIATLVGLAVLNRVNGLGRLNVQLSSQNVMVSDRRRVIFSEIMILLGLIATGLLTASLFMVVVTVLGGIESQLTWSPWTVLFVGIGAALLFVFTLLVWYQPRRGVAPTGTYSSRSGSGAQNVRMSRRGHFNRR